VGSGTLLPGGRGPPPSRAAFLGRARDDLLPGVLSIVVHPTVVFYRVGRGTIDIVRVIDGRRNLAALFERSDR
jgi:plasmid stabilization system protein ParE